MATNWVAESDDPRLNAVRYAWLDSRVRESANTLSHWATEPSAVWLRAPHKHRRHLDGVDAHERVQCADNSLQLLRQVAGVAITEKVRQTAESVLMDCRPGHRSH